MLPQARWPTEDLGIAREGMRRAEVFGVVRYHPPEAPFRPKRKRLSAPPIPLPIVYRRRDSGNWRRNMNDERVRDRIQDIIAASAAAFEVEPKELLTESRKRRVAHPRFAAMHLMRSILRISAPSIGRVFKRDHTTVLAALSKAAQLRRRDRDFSYRSRLIARALRRRWSVDGQAEAQT